MSIGTVVITGASAGVGRATAVAFGRRRWRVALLARGPEGLEGAADEVRRAGGEAFTIPTDVADPAAVERAAQQVVQRWQGFDVWVNNAMATVFCPFDEIAVEDFRRATEVTYLGAVWGTRAALMHMKARNRGVIVQVGSALAYRSIPLQSPYCGAKSALRGFTDALRSELIHARSRVHLTMVHLSAFNTPQFDWGRSCMPRAPKPLGPIFQPEVAGEAIYWAARHRRRELWVGWPAVEAILGQRVVPGWLDHKLAADAYDGQMSDQPIGPGRRDNLHAPVRGEHRMHGRFDSQARGHSLQSWANTHRVLLSLSALALLITLRRLARG